jgi:RNA recognition motif-containing protein
MNIYIANLDNGIESEELKSLFTPFGEVTSAEIVKDVFTGASRGFGYVEMEEEEAANKAIAELNQSVVHTLVITVEQAPVRKAQQGSYKVGNGVNVYRFRKN